MHAQVTAVGILRLSELLLFFAGSLGHEAGQL